MTKTFSDLIVGGIVKQSLGDLYSQLSPEDLYQLRSYYAQPSFKSRLRGAVSSGSEMLGKTKNILGLAGSYAAGPPGDSGMIGHTPLNPSRGYMTDVPAGVMGIDPSQLSLLNAAQTALLGSVVGRLPNA